MSDYSDGMESMDGEFWHIAIIIVGILFAVVFIRGCLPDICADRCSANETQAGYEVCYANCVDVD